MRIMLGGLIIAFALMAASFWFGPVARTEYVVVTATPTDTYEPCDVYSYGYSIPWCH